MPAFGFFVGRESKDHWCCRLHAYTDRSTLPPIPHPKAITVQIISDANCYLHGIKDLLPLLRFWRYYNASADDLEDHMFMLFNLI